MHEARKRNIAINIFYMQANCGHSSLVYRKIIIYNVLVSEIEPDAQACMHNTKME